MLELIHRKAQNYSFYVGRFSLCLKRFSHQSQCFWIFDDLRCPVFCDRTVKLTQAVDNERVHRLCVGRSSLKRLL